MVEVADAGRGPAMMRILAVFVPGIINKARLLNMSNPITTSLNMIDALWRGERMKAASSDDVTR